MKKLILFLIVASLTSVKAQYVVNYKKVADAYFQSRDYYAASTFYKKALKITADSSQVVLPYGKDKKLGSEEKVIEDYEGSLYNLAEASRMYRDYTEAEKYYELASTFSNPKYYKSLFYYAESLRANKKFPQAIAAFEKFIANNKTDGLVKTANLEVLSCKFAMKEMRFPRLVQIKKVPSEINGLGSNYAPIKQGSSFYFTSSRPVAVSGKPDVVKVVKGESPISTKANPFMNKLYSSSSNFQDDKVNVKKIDFNLPNDMEFAAVSFNPEGNVAYFTAWKGQEKYSVYSATKTEDKWSIPQSVGLQVNSKDFNSAQPFVTSDGKFLIFSSDRMGGYGKYDLWYAAIRSDGSIGQAVNLGPEINSEADEKAPYYNTITKKLIFSTDGRIGFGGMDFFESEGDLINWTKPKNMGYPFNSSKDDVYFTPINADASKGYISSDRESACCLEIFEVKREYISVSGIITDCKTKKPLDGVLVKMNDQENDYSFTTDNTGKYNFKMDSKRPVKLNMTKDNYFALNKNYAYEEIAKADTLMYADYCINAFKINVPIVLDNIYYEFNSAELTESSKKVLDALALILDDNPEMEIELGAHTDDVGTDVYNQELSERRAKSCVDYLATKNISQSRLASKGYGESMPIAPNKLKKGKDNPEGRAKNRRTEFKVTKK
ncbi:OmpA family protein [Pedobacter mendelii]|uniref:Cell envelope biogenesis protein OmpA n=1 Tax=Pedobacter mendelii TaxID=1908240 RepID=A0ABQ2BES1_9SPHI|nr:OmpA family protein [Pedobacter mendelii]GGI24487.1 cell envelope biogenesis protein OmpA [Pedobacter mendelii]